MKYINQILKYCVISIAQALVACMAEFLLCWATDAVMANIGSSSEWWAYLTLACVAVNYLCSSMMIVIVCVLYRMWMKKKADSDSKGMHAILILTDIVYGILLLTLFPLLCETVNIGAVAYKRAGS